MVGMGKAAERILLLLPARWLMGQGAQKRASKHVCTHQQCLCAATPQNTLALALVSFLSALGMMDCSLGRARQLPLAVGGTALGKGRQGLWRAAARATVMQAPRPEHNWQPRPQGLAYMCV